jgi:hypothetical protein
LRTGKQQTTKQENILMEIVTKVFHSDAGHGWLAVKRAELHELGIADAITSYSYQKGGTVYLEEDCDAARYIVSMEKRGITVKFKEGKSCDRSPIRSYAMYTV